MKAWLALVALFLVGCTGPITQTVKPVGDLGGDPKEICVIENPDVQHNFFDEYKRVLSDRGFRVRTVMAGTSLADCPLASTYKAVYRWDLRLYLAYANIKVYRRGQQAGDAVYDASAAGASTKKFIVSLEKIRELTDQLFPR